MGVGGMSEMSISEVERRGVVEERHRILEILHHLLNNVVFF